MIISRRKLFKSTALSAAGSALILSNVHTNSVGVSERYAALDGVLLKPVLKRYLPEPVVIDKMEFLRLNDNLLCRVRSNSGMIRSRWVVRMAAFRNIERTPHISGSGLGHLYMMHFISAESNAGPYNELKGFNREIPHECPASDLQSHAGVMKVPTGPGLGVEIDSAFIAKRKVELKRREFINMYENYEFASENIQKQVTS